MPNVRVLAETDPAAYLAPCEVVDSDQASIRTHGARLRAADPLETARRCFEFVRDQIEHSADHRRSPTTCAASQVLRLGHGFCYAKSHLLTALLRSNSLRAGLLYQRLTVDGPSPPHCLHGYVAVELPSYGWYAVDARGNKPGVDARFEPPIERLAFPIQHEGERDFPMIYARPLPAVVDCLRRFETWDTVLNNLPDATDLPDAPHHRPHRGR